MNFINDSSWQTTKNFWMLIEMELVIERREYRQYMDFQKF